MVEHNKVALITDTHYGVRKGSQVFHDHFEKFYSEVFFPTLEERGINKIIHLGDCFDVRKGIDYWSLDWAKRVFFEPCIERGIEVHIICGNHDSFYKSSLKINALRLNLAQYHNVHVYDHPMTLPWGEHSIFMCPWICEDNADDTFNELRKTKAKVCMGHLELAGFYANKDYKCDHGTDPKHFSKFDNVFSGHFHKKSTEGNVTYLGNAYQLYWNDEGETRGFHIFDFDEGQLSFIPNPYNMFAKIYIKDNTEVMYKTFKDTFVKLIIEDKQNPVKLQTIVDKLYDSGAFDIKVIENTDVAIEEDVEVESEDTLTTLTNYVKAMEDGFNKPELINILKSLYVEAQEV